MSMARRPERLLATPLDRMRLGACLFCVGNVLVLVPLQRTDLPGWRWALGESALALTAAICVATWLRGRTYRWDPLIYGPLTVVIACQAGNGVTLLGYPVGVLMAQSMYGSRRAFWTRLAVLEAGTAVVAFTPPSLLHRSDFADTTPITLIMSLVVPALFGTFVRLLSTALMAQVEAGAREALLARTGVEMATVTDLRGIQRVVDRAARELCALKQGMVLLVVHREGEQSEVTGVYGVPDIAPGAKLPANTLVGLDPTNVGQGHRLTVEIEVLDDLIGHHRDWRAFGLGPLSQEGYVLLGTSERRPSEGIVDAVRTLTTQLSLAQANCRSHAELSRLAHQDQLTSIPNRRAFERLLTDAIDTVVGREDSLALLLVDLDDFKQINDGFGHGAGDELLTEVATRLSAVAGERGSAFRFGGDEFAVLLEGLRDPAEAARIASTLRERLREPVRLTLGTNVCVGASIGVVTGTPGAGMNDLMRAADIAMYSAKALGKNRCEVFSPERHGDVNQLRLLEGDFPQALDRGEIVLHYQPVIDAESGRWHAVEAFARWRHPKLGMLNPDVLLPLAERLGQLGALTAHVLRVACDTLTTWPAELTVSVNVSTRQLATPDFIGVVRDTLAETGVAPARLLLELTEADALTLTLPCPQIEALNTLGVRFGLDRFGIGGTSLAYLRGLRLGQLKIDPRVFLEGDVAESDDVLAMIVAVGGVLHLDIVAAMLEDSEQVDRARRAGANLVQGFYYTQPLTAEQMTAHFAGESRGAGPSSLQTMP